MATEVRSREGEDFTFSSSLQGSVLLDLFDSKYLVGQWNYCFLTEDLGFRILIVSTKRFEANMNNWKS